MKVLLLAQKTGQVVAVHEVSSVAARDGVASRFVAGPAQIVLELDVPQELTIHRDIRDIHRALFDYDIERHEGAHVLVRKRTSAARGPDKA